MIDRQSSMLGSRPLEATPKALSNDAEGRTTDIEKNAIVDNIAATPSNGATPTELECYMSSNESTSPKNGGLELIDRIGKAGLRSVRSMNPARYRIHIPRQHTVIVI